MNLTRALIVLVLLAVVLTLLFAPQSGEETRADVQETLGRWANDFFAFWGNLVNQIGEFLAGIGEEIQSPQEGSQGIEFKFNG